MFLPPVRYAATADELLLVADLDGDGASEILTSGNQVDQRDVFSLFHNRGDGTFEAERHIPSRLGERLEDRADLNRDGIMDLVVADYWMNGIAIYRGLGSLQFDGGTRYVTATHGGPTRVVDYDRDGIQDLVSFSSGSANPVRVHLFRGRGDGTFHDKQTFDVPFEIAASASTRIRNVVLEALIVDRTGLLGIVRIDAAGVSLSTRPAGPGLLLTALFADVNGDGIEDIVDTNEGASETAFNPFEWIFITPANPAGGFLERKQLQVRRQVTFPADLRTGDLDGDGHLDLVVSDLGRPVLHYFRGDGTGRFSDGVAINAGAPVNDIAVSDVDGDRRLDLVTANNDQSVSVIRNSGQCLPPRRRAVRH